MTVVRSIRRVGVVGAASQVGQALLPRLAAQGIRVCRIGRETGLGGAEQVHVYDADRGCFEPPIDAADALVSLAPLPSIGVVLDMARLVGARRVIAFGSTGRFSKVNSSSTLELDFVAQQEQAERLFSSRCEAAGVAWTLFRPTMIYGADADQSVAFVKAMVGRFGFFPIPWGATGLRQPVHLDDLAAACVSALECERTFGRAYNLGGGEVLRFPDLVRRIFEAAHRRPMLVPVPLTLYYLVVAAASKFAGAAFVRREMVDRMYQDLVADNQPAREDFDYAPRRFSPTQNAS